MGKCIERLLHLWRPLWKYFQKLKTEKDKKAAKKEKASKPKVKSSPAQRKSNPTQDVNSKTAQSQSKHSSTSSSSTFSGREERITRNLTSFRTLAYVYFLDFIFPTFDAVNMTLQTESPLIHKVLSLLNDL